MGRWAERTVQILHITLRWWLQRTIAQGGQQNEVGGLVGQPGQQQEARSGFFQPRAGTLTIEI